MGLESWQLQWPLLKSKMKRGVSRLSRSRWFAENNDDRAQRLVLVVRRQVKFIISRDSLFCDKYSTEKTRTKRRERGVVYLLIDFYAIVTLSKSDMNWLRLGRPRPVIVFELPKA